MSREFPWLEPRSCAAVNCSSPSTRNPRRATWYAAGPPPPPPPRGGEGARGGAADPAEPDHDDVKGSGHDRRRLGPCLAEGGEALGDVDERRVLGGDPPEQRPGGGDVAGPLVEVGQGVPEPQVMGEHPLRVSRGPL